MIISTFATIYSISDDNHETASWNLKKALQSDPSLNPLKAYTLMLFILIYVPCIAVLGVFKRETGGWGWVGLMVIYTLSLAWLISFAFINVIKLIS